MNIEPNWTEVEGSSNIAGFAYISSDLLADVGTLFIKFGSGSAYKYVDFPDQLAEDFFTADSKGKFFHANIRAFFPGERYIANELQDDLEDVVEDMVEAVDELVKLTDASQEDGQDLEDLREEIVDATIKLADLNAQDPEEKLIIAEDEFGSLDEAGELTLGDEGPVS